LVKSVLQTPVSSIMPTRNGMMARAGMIVVAIVAVEATGTRASAEEEGRDSRESRGLEVPG
jgi:hypothetical protein